MNPVLLESTQYGDLRSNWLRSSHEPGLYVAQGEPDAVKHEVQKLHTHWQDQAVGISVDHPYYSLPIIYQLNPVLPSSDLVACKNALLRFRTAGWAPGHKKWVLVEVASHLHASDLGAIHHILYRQKLRGVSVLLFFHRYSTRMPTPSEVHQLPISLVRETPEHTRSSLEQHFADARKKGGQEKTLALYNRLAWILLSKSDDPVRYRACLHFFKHNTLFQRLTAAQQAVLWFELAQLLTKKGLDYTAARYCYSEARKMLSHKELTEVYRIGKCCALDNGEALIEMQEGNSGRAIELERQASRRIQQLPDGPDRRTFQIQTGLNMAGLQLRSGQWAEADTALLAAEKLCTDQYVDWLGPILELRMEIHRQRGKEEKEYQLLIRLLRLRTVSIHAKRLRRAVEIAGEQVRRGSNDRAAEVYRLLIMSLPAVNLPQIEKIRQAISNLETDISSDTAMLDQYIAKLRNQLDEWEQLKRWNEGREASCIVHS
ncbi:hypothetical protein P5G61_15665 [Paenibacillus sp. F6_3S_P_1C]|uniref:MalT-like TPR region domain-containing protein n=1 Tax=Paenibacillus vandeheii TaxID=3035917 RepID=A0ABT8JC39_9BACL|nr:hypothetical protein [Paenibacillus vandeheii]MDN4602674.1 hypothetical protein [Paenibacillus vandeheii]